MRTKKGIVSSNKMEKTLVITVRDYKFHPKYQKKYRVSSKFYAHVDNSKLYSIGDEVIIIASRPMSKLKRWKVIKASE